MLGRSSRRVGFLVKGRRETTTLRGHARRRDEGLEMVALQTDRSWRAFDYSRHSIPILAVLQLSLRSWGGIVWWGMNVGAPWETS